MQGRLIINSSPAQLVARKVLKAQPSSPLTVIKRSIGQTFFGIPGELIEFSSIKLVQAKTLEIDKVRIIIGKIAKIQFETNLLIFKVYRIIL